MPKVGDRVVIEGTKVGAQRREGDLLEMTGRLIKVRWSDGTESLFTPGAGSVTFLPGSGRNRSARPSDKPKTSAKTTAKTSAKTASKKPAAKKKPSKKR